VPPAIGCSIRIRLSIGNAMSYKQVHEVLERVKLFYQQLSDYYEDLSDDLPEDDQVHRLLEYMGRHEKAFNRTLAKYERDAAEGVLNTWLQYAPDERTWRALQHAEIRPDMSLDEVMEQALDVDQDLRDMYRQLADESSVPRVQELFQSLLEMQESKDAQYARTLLDEVRETRKEGRR
jgi:rubrerythrin